MNYKKTTKIIVDKRKLDLLIRLGCPTEQILQVLSKGTFAKTGDTLIDDTLECLADFKDFTNWGGKREGAGRKPDNQDENQDDLQDENQDGGQDGDKDKDKDIGKDSKLVSSILNNKYIKSNSSKLVISSKFKVKNIPELQVYVNEMPSDVIESVEKWLIKTKLNQTIDLQFIAKQFINFAKRQGRPLFKEQDK